MARNCGQIIKFVFVASIPFMKLLKGWRDSVQSYNTRLRIRRSRVDRRRIDLAPRVEPLRQRAASASERLGGVSIKKLWSEGLSPRKRLQSRVTTGIGALSKRLFSSTDDEARERDLTPGSSPLTSHASTDLPSADAVSAEQRPVQGRSRDEDKRPGREQLATSSGREFDFPARPSLEEFGRLGAHYLLSERSWVRRHVETATLKNLQSARRRLTIDIMLPREPDCAVRDGDRNLYFMPVAILAKQPITSYIDFVDESDHSLSLLTREENGFVSLAAVEEAGRRLLGSDPLLPLRRAWAELITRDGLEAALALHIAEELSERWYPQIVDEANSGYVWFVRTLRDLAANSLVWLPLHGHGGDRRIVKLRCEVAAGPPKLRPRRDAVIRVNAMLDDGQLHPVEHIEPGDGDPRGALGRIINRIGNTLGLTAMSVALTSPSIRGSNTYHLQLESPPGLEIQSLTLFADLQQRRVAPHELKTTVENDRDSAHLYLTGGEVKEMQPAVAELRVASRGFLSLSALSGLMIVAMLWAYNAAAPIDQARHSPEVEAAVLLVVPVLLLAFVVRLGEHPYATRMLVGVRACMLALGLLAVADAAAIVAVKPSAWTLHHTWFVCAVLGSIVGGVLAFGWLLALRMTRLIWGFLNRVWESRLVYSVSCLIVAALVGAAIGTGDLDARSATAIPALGAGVPLALAFACWMLIATPAARESYPPAGLSCVSGAAALVAACFLLNGSIAKVGWHSAWKMLVALVVGAIAISLLYELIGVFLSRAGNSPVADESS